MTAGQGGMPPENDDGFLFGDLVSILGSGVKGFVVGWICHARREDAYFVEYVDANGNPQEKCWSESQLTLIDRTEPAASSGEVEDLEGEEADNVVPLRRAGN